MSQLVSGLYRVIIKKDTDKRFARVGDKNTPVLNLKVVPYKTKDGDNYGTEWIQVSVWGKPAEWYNPIDHNTVVFIQGAKDIKVDGEYVNPTISISSMSDIFQPVQIIRYSDSYNESVKDQVEEPEQVSVDDIPF